MTDSAKDAASDAASALAAATSAPSTYTARKRFVFQGQTIYEWEQSLEEVTMYFTPPPGLPARALDVTIAATHLTIGIKGVPRPFIDEDFEGRVNTEESVWTLGDGVLTISLQKSKMGEPWACAVKGHKQMTEAEEEQVKQKILLERFQRENPGFDFSNATFSGAAPDASSFLGGVNPDALKR